MKKCPKCGKQYETTNTLCPADGTALVQSGDGLIGQTLADKYRVEERISEGGMGTVYRGTHILMEKLVAIKVLHPALAADEKIVARFTREARAASRISHPHALTVTDFGESDNGTVFLVMEYLRGRTLKQVVREEGPLPLARVVEITRQIAGALDAAHAEGVVHRDLKSDNIMLEEVGNGQDWAKVLDFGIAKIQEPVGQDPELTAPNLIIGTPQYMSPEQCSQTSEIDARSDIYSFGIILYEMLAGHVPFTGESATAIMLKQLQEPAPSVLDERTDLPPAVGDVIARAMAKQREERQASAGALAEALAAAAETAAPAAAAGAAATARGSNTDRIVVSTSAGETRTTTNADYDEATVVRSAARTDAHPELDELAQYDAPPAAKTNGFDPWRIMIPAGVVLLLVLGVFFALQRNAGPAGANDNAAPLIADPNAQAAQPLGSPTGAAENGVAPNSAGPGAPPPSAGSTDSLAGASQPAVNSNPPADNANVNADTPRNDNAAHNDNSPRNDNTARNDNAPRNENADTATDPPPPVRNDNRANRPTPSPTPAPTNPADPPPPVRRPTPQPTPPPAGTAPPLGPSEGSPPPPAVR